MSEQPERKERRPAGRPKGPEPGSSVTTWVPRSRHDRLIEMAQARGLSVSGFLRVVVFRVTQQRP